MKTDLICLVLPAWKMKQLDQVQIFRNGHEVINPREKVRIGAFEGVQDILKDVVAFYIVGGTLFI